MKYGSLVLPENYYHPSCYWMQMISYKCLGNCRYCIIDGRGKHTPKHSEMPSTEIIRWWNSINHDEGQKLSLVGGEPTLRSDLPDMINNLEGYNITITTNCFGPFYNSGGYTNVFKPKKSSSLRINTSYHPHTMPAEQYIEVIKNYKETGHNIDQIGIVFAPDTMVLYKDRVEKVNKVLPVTSPPFLGFYNDHDLYDSPFHPRFCHPNESFPDMDSVINQCGIKDFEAYRDMCGQYLKRQVTCLHPYLSLILNPEGYVYHCHYKLYYDIDPVCHVSAFRPVSGIHTDCMHYGFCNWCDLPRVGGKANEGAKYYPLNTLYSAVGSQRSEVGYLMNNIREFADNNGFLVDPTKWFEYAYAILYSGHKHGSKVLFVGDINSVLPAFLKHIGYTVTILVSEEEAAKLNEDKIKDLGLRVLVHDINEHLTGMQMEYDLVIASGVASSVEDDSRVISFLASYTKPGGVFFTSADFYHTYIEYPDANRTIVTDRTDQPDSRIYTPEAFQERVIDVLSQDDWFVPLGLVDYQNVNLHDPEQLAVRGLYTYGIATLIRAR